MDVERQAKYFAYSRENLGKRDPQYGGILTDLAELPVGTSFFVSNGCWGGKIIEIDGERFIEYEWDGVSCRPDGKFSPRPLRKGEAENILALSDIHYPGTRSLIWMMDATFKDGTTAKFSLSASVSDTLSFEQTKMVVLEKSKDFVQRNLQNCVQWLLEWRWRGQVD